MEPLVWIDDQTFRIGAVTFGLTIEDRFQSAPGHFMLVKHRHMVERYEELFATLRPRRVVELGICQGGSAAFIVLRNDLERFVALDIKDSPTPALEHFVVDRGLSDRVHTEYGFDQADAPRLRRLLAGEFGDERLDLVIDDASHRLAPTRISFNVLFPHLRPGGVYVIEDWSGLHHKDAVLSARAAHDPELRAKLGAAAVRGIERDTPLSVMLFELVLAAAYAPELFAEVRVIDDWAYVVRGPGPIDPETFDLSRVYTANARRLLGRTE
jgi:hypothetical protein